ncbi:CrcB family protein [Bifidobacterium aquikefiricola]|uniref:Fluoride-specific ion channel FluC n=1 Tax=Bifidobacterium aquikefiricola TaxID=3059038 RepID=A0AB39U7Q3_9BIFI
MNTQSVLTFTFMALCGGVGAVCRFLVDSTVNKRNRLNFPLGTIAVNISACLLLGLLTGWVSSWNAADAQTIRFILGTGLLGGYSTFSTASVEGYRLIQHQHPLRVLVHTGGMLMICLGAGILGIWCGSL